ncbi:MAG: hypothetical protein ACE5I1_04280, partial [bacterium]
MRIFVGMCVFLFAGVLAASAFAQAEYSATRFARMLQLLGDPQSGQRQFASVLKKMRTDQVFNRKLRLMYQRPETRQLAAVFESDPAQLRLLSSPTTNPRFAQNLRRTIMQTLASAKSFDRFSYTAFAGRN